MKAAQAVVILCQQLSQHIVDQTTETHHPCPQGAQFFMARSGNANIIPFDDARRMASMRSSRPAVVETARAVGDAYGDGSRRHASLDAAVPSRPSAGMGGYASSSYGVRAASPALPPLPRSSRDIRLGGVSPRADRGFSSVPSGAPSDSFDVDGPSASRSAVEVYEGSDGRVLDASSRAQRSYDKRRAKAKQKADRLFFKQFGADEPASSPHASRAAVYKGEMGKAHKRAFSDLESGRAVSSSDARRSSARSAKAPRTSTPPLAVFAGIAACLVFALVLLYPAAQTYYLETREQSRLQAEYDALSARNEAIESQLEYLKTDEGIEDAAHKELGWVYDGQVAGVVRGLGDDKGTAQEELIAQVKSGSVPAPETWYSPMLDVLFGYVDPAKVMPENTDMSNVSDVAADQPSTDGAETS